MGQKSGYSSGNIVPVCQNNPSLYSRERFPSSQAEKTHIAEGSKLLVVPFPCHGLGRILDNNYIRVGKQGAETVNIRRYSEKVCGDDAKKGLLGFVAYIEYVGFIGFVVFDVLLTNS